MRQTITVTNNRGRRFNVAVVLGGERYGLHDVIVHDGQYASDALVEFYDATYENDPKFDDHGRGQFVARYHLSTLVEHESGEARALCLDGGVSVWRVTAANVREAIAFAKGAVAAIVSDDDEARAFAKGVLAATEDESLDDPEFSWSRVSALWQLEHGEPRSARTESARVWLRRTLDELGLVEGEGR